jgi:hypothetical protein
LKAEKERSQRQMQAKDKIIADFREENRVLKSKVEDAKRGRRDRSPPQAPWRGAA